MQTQTQTKVLAITTLLETTQILSQVGLTITTPQSEMLFQITIRAIHSSIKPTQMEQTQITLLVHKITQITPEDMLLVTILQTITRKITRTKAHLAEPINQQIHFSEIRKTQKRVSAIQI